MGQKPNIKTDVKKYINKRASDERKMTLDTLVKRITQELKKDKKTPPAPSTMKKMISAVRNREPNPEDQPWHMGTWKEYPLAVASLAAVMGAYRFAAEHKATLTIREAKWIGRLSVVAQRMFPTLSDRELGPLLILWAVEYAGEEIWSEVSGEDFDTTKLDFWVAMGEHIPQQWELLAILSLNDRESMSEKAGGAWVKKNKQAVDAWREWRKTFQTAFDESVEPDREEPGLKEAIEQFIHELDSNKEGK